MKPAARRRVLLLAALALVAAAAAVILWLPPPVQGTAPAPARSPTSAPAPARAATRRRRGAGAARTTTSPCRRRPGASRARRLRRRAASTHEGVTTPVLPEGREALRPHRRARRPARRLPGGLRLRRRRRCSSTWSSCRAGASRRSPSPGTAARRTQGGQRWFHLYPGEHVDHRDVLHWTKPSQNWNTQCAECHSTNLRKGYRLAEDRFADHVRRDRRRPARPATGPGSRHVEWAGRRQARGPTPRRGAGPHRPLRRAAQPGVGDGPGARDREAHEVPATPASRWRPARAATPGAGCSPRTTGRAGCSPRRTGPRSSTKGSTTPTGRCGTRSTTGARSSRAGCTRPASPARTATTPHDRQGQGRAGTTCARSCHQPERFATRRHHFHREKGRGASCVACHMRTETYMVVDPRHDHSFRVPRPGPHGRARPGERPERVQRLPPRPLGGVGGASGAPVVPRRAAGEAALRHGPPRAGRTCRPAAEQPLLAVAPRREGAGDRARRPPSRSCRRTSGPQSLPALEKAAARPRPAGAAGGGRRPSRPCPRRSGCGSASTCCGTRAGGAGGGGRRVRRRAGRRARDRGAGGLRPLARRLRPRPALERASAPSRTSTSGS